MKKTFTFFAAMAMLASVSFAQNGKLLRQAAQRMVIAPGNFQKATKATKDANCDPITAMPWEEGFENGTDCWTFTQAHDTMGFVAYPNNSQYQYAHSGNYYLLGTYSDNYNVSQWAVSPAITLPAEADDFTLSYYIWMNVYDGISTNYEVRISTSNADTASFTTVLFSESGSSHNAYVKRTLSLGSYAGQTIRIAFHNKTRRGGDAMFLDDIRIGPLAIPELTLSGPTAAPTNVPITFVATCDFNTFTWTVDGNTASTTGDTLTTTFNTVDVHEVIVSVSNAVGTVSDTINIEIFSCEDITLPYTPNFNGGIGCWDTVCDSIHGTGWFASVDMFADTPIGQVLSISAYDPYGIGWFMDIPVDNWLISPEITMPASGTHEIAWQVKPINSDYDGDHYGVYVINGENTILLYEESLTGMTNWNKRIIGIPDSITGTFQVAFRHFDSEGGYVIILDSIQIRDLTAPEVSVVGPIFAETNDPVTFTAASGTAINYEWTVDGEVANTTGNTLTTTFTTVGNHTVQVVGINSVGRSAAATLTVNVFSCDAVTEFPWIEDFEDATGYDCWKFIDADGDGYNWTTDYLRTSSTPAAHNGSRGMAASASYASAPLHPDNWMILPAMTLPEGSNLILSWFEKGQDVNDFAEKYSVYISTTGHQISDFTAAAYTTTTRNEWKGNNLELAQYAGQTIYIAFRHYDCTNMFYLDIDDIKVSNERVGIDDIDNHILSLYPNPASQMVAVNAEGIEGNVTVQIVDLNGRVMMQQQGAAQSFRFDVSTLAQGAYFVRMTGENINAVRKLIVK